jgi:hypothetical protein
MTIYCKTLTKPNILASKLVQPPSSSERLICSSKSTTKLKERYKILFVRFNQHKILQQHFMNNQRKIATIPLDANGIKYFGFSHNSRIYES